MERRLQWSCERLPLLCKETTLLLRSDKPTAKRQDLLNIQSENLNWLLALTWLHLFFLSWGDALQAKWPNPILSR